MDADKSTNPEVEYEIFAVVAAPASGAAVRIYHRASRNETDPAALGRYAAEKLLESGAGPLLALAGEPAL